MSKKYDLNWLYPSKWRGLWDLIWRDNSLLSWAINVILAFIIIKFVIYPVLGLLFGTGFPIVAVVSGSMEHSGSFDDWWGSTALCDNNFCSQEEYYSSFGISSASFESFDFTNGFNKGDLVVLFGSDPGKVGVGDVLVFWSNRPDPIIHRVIKIWYMGSEIHFATKGDNNYRSFPEILESDITRDRVVGKAVLRIPFLGWVKIGFVELLNLLGR
jgi:signal peptidase I